MKRIPWLFLIGGVLLSCAKDSPFISQNGVILSMEKIASAGKSFEQGWNDPLASVSEKPAMQSSFTYDFYLDTTEVTQKHFLDLMGRRPVPESTPYGTGETYPVYYVTWFDAVLFCNARSLLEKLDTVYTYSAIKALSSGSVYELTGLRCNFSRDGYRLPTEAEWEFAGRGGSSDVPYSTQADSLPAQRRAWYVVNSNAKLSPVAQKEPNSLGLYDMAGSLFEWTNDWKGPYSASPVTNCLGAEKPNDQYEKAIKGGSFKHSYLFLRPSYRSANYATTLSTACEYVGFRCARGTIPHGQYIGNSSTIRTTNPVDVKVGASDMRSFVGSSRSKLVFVNVSAQARTLCLVDFSSTYPNVHEFRDDSEVHTPTISPDGRYVAYCNRDEWVYDSSRVSIRPLSTTVSLIIQFSTGIAAVPRWWIDRTTGDTGLIYIDSDLTDGSVASLSAKTYFQKISAGQCAGAPREMCASGGFHDGLSSNGRYLLNASKDLVVYDRISGASTQLFLSPANGKDGNGSTQVCNASLSPDTGDNPRCLFLDFGYNRVSSIVGKSYVLHQYLFIASITGDIVDFIDRPANEAVWDCSEWSNRESFAVACARNQAEQAQHIYAINLKNHASLQLAAGEELAQPALWLSEIAVNSSNYALDSLCMYDDPHVDMIQTFFTFLLRHFWKRHDQLDLVFIGNSQIHSGIDCSAFSSYRAMNIVSAGCGLATTTRMIADYVLTHASNVKLIGITTFLYYLAGPSGDYYEGDNSPLFWDITMGQSKGYTYDKNHNFWNNTLSDELQQLMWNQPYPNLSESFASGYTAWPINGWGGSALSLEGDITWTIENQNYKKNMAALVELIKLVSSHKIHLLAINFPENPQYKNTTHYTRYGPSRATGAAVLEQYRSLEKEFPYFHLYDANLAGAHDYSEQEASDFNHLSYKGAIKLTTRVDSLVRGILGQ
jgi:uncharacterized protein (TIGR02171 family)